MIGLVRWERVLVGAGAAKASLGIVLYLVAVLVDAERLSPRTHLMAAHVVAYGVIGLFLIWRGAGDRRAVLWGVNLLLVASVFTDPTLGGVAAGFEWARPALGLGRLLQLNAFTPYFLWRFVTEFPRVSWFGTRAFVLRTFRQVSLGLGVALLALNVIGLLLASPTEPEPQSNSPLWAFLRENSGGVYWPLIFLVALPAAVALFMKLPTARPSEKRRVWLLATGYVLGSLPTTIWVLATNFWPVVYEVLPLSLAGWVIYPALLSPPFTTAYAVVVHQALDVRLVARSALRFTTARYALATLAAIPMVGLIASFYNNRSRTLSELLTDVRAVMLMVLTMAALVGVKWRAAILDRVDRLFFREVYQARRVLGELVERCGSALGAAELAAMITDGMNRAFNPEATHVMLLSDGRYVSPEGGHRPLSAGSPLLRLLAGKGGSMPVDLSRIGSAVRDEIPEEDRFWLADGGVRFLVGMRDAQERTVGLIALGEKHSELPYTHEDRRRIEEVGRTAAVALGYMELHRGPSAARVSEQERSEPDDGAKECVQCGAVTGPTEITCSICGGELSLAPVPLTLANKFRFVARVGAGGMGVVYRAVDLSLGRSVAIKTLPRTTPGHAARLRQEARSMASVSHPNLALIFGGESWHGVPMLVFEYLGGGTLDDKLKKGPLPTADVVSVGTALAGAVDAIHRAGILHRDIKPSNIGFTEDGLLKLLDFGLARILGGAQDRTGAPADRMHGARFPAEQSNFEPNITATSEHQIVGTPIYLSPEAVEGEFPDPRDDLWALALSLYEAAAGVNPVEKRTLALTFVQLLHSGVPDLLDVAPAADPSLAAFFRLALSKDKSERPRSAKELAARLSAVNAARAA